MDFENFGPFAALAYETVDSRGDAYEVVAARGTYALRVAAGARGITHVAVPLDEQPELVFSDAYHGEMNRSSVAVESDLAQQKPRCDVIVLGAAHSPSGEPVPRVEVGIEVARDAAPSGHEGDSRLQTSSVAEVAPLLSRRLVVHGPRAFEHRGAREGAGGWVLTDPEPFSALPIRYEHAFGGELSIRAEDEAAGRLDDAHRLSDEVRAKHPDAPRAPVAHTICTHNPVGVGWLEGWYADALRVERWPAPRIEAPGAEITADHFERLLRGELHAGASAELTPQGFGVVAKPWQPRLAHAGTLDARWLEERWPLMPDDFDMAYWNGAHPDMQCPHLRGGERVTLWNLLPPSAPGVVRDDGGRAACRFALPAVRVAVRLGNDHDQEAWIAARIDTMIVDLAEMRLSLVWRVVVPAAGVASAALVTMGETHTPTSPTVE